MTTLHSIKPVQVQHFREEKVGVSKIRIRQPRVQATAILGSFVAADKLLRAWASCTHDYFECEFEILYLDGYHVSGLYPIWQKCTTRQSLGAYVRRIIEEMAGVNGRLPPKKALAPFHFSQRGAAAADGMLEPEEQLWFLDTYETEDFAERDAH
jgi:hypothetical protein